MQTVCMMVCVYLNHTEGNAVMAVRSDFSEKVRNSDFSPKMGQKKV